MLQYLNEKKTCKDFDDDKNHHQYHNYFCRFTTNKLYKVMQYIYLTQIWFGECN